MSEVLGQTAQSQLKAVIERVERVEEDISALKKDRGEIYAEAKGNGFDVKIIRKIVSLRRKSTAARQEEEQLLDLYLSAIGGL